jgi:hypothetical protein
MTSHAVRAPLLLAFAFALATRTAGAQASGVATELFTAGRDLMRQGDYAAACPKLAESARLDAKVGTLARLAECEEKLGHMVDARGDWQKAVNLASSEHDDRLVHVQQEFVRVDHLVPKVVFQTTGAAPPALSVTIDALTVGEGSTGVPLPVDVGKHLLGASAPGRISWSTTIEARAGGVVTVTIPPLAVESAAPPPPVAPLPPAPVGPPHTTDQSSSILRPAGLVTAGVGLAGVGVGAVFGILAKSKLNTSNAIGCDANNVCSTGGSPSAFETRNQARTFGDVSTATFIVGGLLAAAGVTLFLLAPRSEARPTAGSVTASPVVDANGGGVLVRGAF